MSEDTFSYDYPHAVGTVPAGAARIVDETGTTWALSQSAAVAGGRYLWGRIDDPADPAPAPTLFRTIVQVGRHYGLSQDAQARARMAEAQQHTRQTRRPTETGMRLFRSHRTGIVAVFDRNDRCTGTITRTGLVMAHPDTFTLDQCTSPEEFEELALVPLDSLPPEGYTIVRDECSHPTSSA